MENEITDGSEGSQRDVTDFEAGFASNYDGTTLCSPVTSVVNHLQKIIKNFSNHSGMLIGLSIAILCFLARKITAEERKSYIRLRVPQRHSAVTFPFGSCCVPGQAVPIW